MITTIEGGMVFTNQKDLYVKAQAIRTQGETSKYIHNYLGNNYRMTDLMAAIGASQIERIETKLKQRKTKVEYYKENLEHVEYPPELPHTVNSYFLFLILVNNRDKLMNHLHKKGIDTRITYPMPINEQPIFRQYSNEVFPVAREMSQRVLSLPLYQGLTEEEQAYIVQEINAFRR
jgi:perosamine synthetase